MTDDLRSDRGVTLPELLIAILISALALALLGAMVSSGTRAEIFTRDDSAALDDMRITAERITKEVRQARLLYGDSTDYVAHFWVDFDLDNQQDLDERIFWALRDDGTGDFDLVRYTEAEPTQVVISEYAIDAGPVFTYDPLLPDVVRTVNFAIAFDVNTAQPPVAHTVESAIRLRNQATP